MPLPQSVSVNSIKKKNADNNKDNDDLLFYFIQR